MGKYSSMYENMRGCATRYAVLRDRKYISNEQLKIRRSNTNEVYSLSCDSKDLITMDEMSELEIQTMRKIQRNIISLDLLHSRILDIDVMNIKHLTRPSEWIQLEIVRTSPIYIRFIDDPTPKVIESIILKSGMNIKLLKKPSEKQKILAVNKSASAIRYINNPSEELQLIAVRKSPTALRYIRNPSDIVIETANNMRAKKERIKL